MSGHGKIKPYPINLIQEKKRSPSRAGVGFLQLLGPPAYRLPEIRESWAHLIPRTTAAALPLFEAKLLQFPSTGGQVGWGLPRQARRLYSIPTVRLLIQ